MLSKLEHRAGGRVDAEAEQVMAVVSAIRKILSKAEESTGPQVLARIFLSAAQPQPKAPLAT
ncbi:MAG: hypothetical protein ACP5MD_11990, partial [Verrucomicrobiia bacterium]